MPCYGGDALGIDYIFVCNKCRKKSEAEIHNYIHEKERESICNFIIKHAYCDMGDNSFSLIDESNLWRHDGTYERYER